MIELKGVSKKYGITKAVEDVSLHFRRARSWACSVKTARERPR